MNSNNHSERDVLNAHIAKTNNKLHGLGMISPPPKHATKISFDGPVGKIECLELLPLDQMYATNPKGFAIVLHPNPVAGGSYTNKVVQTMAGALNQKGYAAYCPNLRGVGESDGLHDFAHGEVDDVISIHQALKQRYDGQFVLAGFSFGAFVASKVATKIAPPQWLILAGMPVGIFGHTEDLLIPSDISMNAGLATMRSIIIHGQEDELIPLQKILDFASANNQEVTIFPKTGHFFHGRLNLLKNYLVKLDL